MTDKARTLARRLAAGGRFTVRLTKRDGTARQMRFDIDPNSTVRFASGSPRVYVYDLEKQGWRTLRLDAVSQLTQVPTRVPTMAEAQAGADLMFS